MSTVMRNRTGPMVPPPAMKPGGDQQLRRDRWTAVLVVAIIAAMMGLIIWLASMSGTVVHEGIDYWPMMP